MLKIKAEILLLSIIFLSALFLSCEQKRKFTDAELKDIGKFIFENECSMDIQCLTSWNEGEEFGSFGIGHFIWYPKNKDQIFEESFPKFISFLSRKNIDIPTWITNDGDKNPPWDNRRDFLADINDKKLSELRSLLKNTMDLQTLFIIERMENSSQNIINKAAPDRKAHVKKQFYRLYNSHYGIYLLIDYINFKGEGTSVNERYNGSGWGLLQVLNHMEYTDDSSKVINNFVQSAIYVLNRRVGNSPANRNEHKWIEGWTNRMNRYLLLDTRNKTVN